MHFVVKHAKKVEKIWQSVVGVFYVLLATLLITAAIYVGRQSPGHSYLVPTALALLCMILAGRRFVRM